MEWDKTKSIELMKEEAAKADWVKDFQKAPFKKIRIHIVEYPLTSYLEWEIEHYKNINVPLCGEEVYLIKKEDTSNLDLPDGDFVIFDEQRVAKNYYDETGKVYKMDFYDSRDDISNFLNLKRDLIRVPSLTVLGKLF